MAEMTITLTGEEATELARILDQVLKEVRVEVHHTHTPDYRDSVQKEERLIRGILGKVHRKD